MGIFDRVNSEFAAQQGRKPGNTYEGLIQLMKIGFAKTANKKEAFQYIDHIVTEVKAFCETTNKAWCPISVVYTHLLSHTKKADNSWLWA